MAFKFKRFKKFLIAILSLFVLFIISIYCLSWYSEKNNQPAKNIAFGVTFSQIAVESLGLDWKKVYQEILDDLNVKNIRLPSYWSIVEKIEGKYDFSDTDFLISEAEKRNVKVILTVGVKQPRWPECHLPVWARKLSTKDRQQKVLEYIKAIVNRYKSSSSIKAWQVENEPFFYPYGDNCYLPDAKFLEEEIKTVKSLDSKPIIVSETGELTLWGKQMQLSDIFGTTLYRTVWNPVTGYFNYPITPGFYSLRSNFFRKFFAPNNKKTIVIELQAEPWLPKNNPRNTLINKQAEIFSLQQMKDNIDFAQRTGFDEIYLWGVEWWYFMKQAGHGEYWDYAQKLFK